jgi:hypothetical protein
MEKVIREYIQKNLIVFSVNIEHKQNKAGEWKKNIFFPKNWQNYTINSSFYNNKYNGLAMLTGKINNIFVIDIDNIGQWEQFLKIHDQKEPKTIKVSSGSGGIHLYFQYSDDLENIKTTSKCFGNNYDIDIRTNGGCIIIPPTKYFNNNLNKEVEYKWTMSIFEKELKPVPLWLKKILLEEKKEEKEKKKKNNNNEDIQNLKIDKEDEEIDFLLKDIENIVDMLSIKRCDNYSDWIAVGICLYNINKYYMGIWIKWSQKSDKYDEGSCEKKWSSFKKEKEGLKIGSLLLWAKMDNPNQYESFMRKKKLNKVIFSKYPDDKLILGDTVFVNNKCQMTHLHNKECLIKGSEHNDMPNSMYVEILDKYMTIKCRHPECFGHTYPCNHILMNKNETNIAFHGDVNITINQNSDDLVEFQKIDIYEDNELNELVFNSLNGGATQFAEIIYYFYKDVFNYGEDENWYIYENHKWKNIGRKNTNLRYIIDKKLKELYTQLLEFYKDNDSDKNKIKALKNTIKNFGETNQKNNVITELQDIYLMKNNINRVANSRVKT